jgi:hypothetical protein
MAIPNVKCFFKPDLSSQFAELREELSIAQQRIKALTKEAETLLGGLLSISERDIIREVDKTKKMFNLGLREKNVTDLKSKFDSMLFTKLVENLHRECPTITNILEQLVLSFNASRNTKKTIDMKMKASVHLLASLMDVRDQRAGNDIPVFVWLPLSLLWSWTIGNCSVSAFGAVRIISSFVSTCILFH